MTPTELLSEIASLFQGNSGPAPRLEGAKVVVPEFIELGQYSWPRLEFSLAPDNSQVIIATIYDSEGPRSSLFGTVMSAYTWALEA